ncbi:MAG: hypothetical protein NTV74_06870 [Euryarchaeota archaeon]|nr:hypothetical protein [Euryarchaeota archaeon]
MDKKNTAIIMLSIIVVALFATIFGMLSTDINTNSAEMGKFVGKWTPSARLIMLYESYNFKENGTFVKVDEMFLGGDVNIYQTEIRNGTYQVQDGKLILTFEDSEVIVYQYIFSKNNNSVILINNASLDEVFNFEDSPNILRYTWIRE